MPGLPYHISVESVRWRDTLPSLHLFDSFRLAIHPAKLALAYVLVALLYLLGLALDALWPDANPFATAVGRGSMHFGNLVASAASLDVGFDAVGQRNAAGVLPALYGLFVELPVGLWRNCPWAVAIYLALAFAMIALFGGAISRLAALHACRDVRRNPMQAIRYAAARYLWFVLAPLLPLVLAGFGALLLGLAGLVFFSVPGLDVVGGLLMALFLLLGLMLAVTLLGFAVGVHLLYPAISVEGADAFDAISRAYNYVLGRPGRFLVYAFVSLVIFALTYLGVGLVLHAALWLTDGLLTWGSVGNRYVDAQHPNAGGTLRAAGGLVDFWRAALLLLLPAYAVSFYYSASTWIYLLLRRSADKVHFDELHAPEDARLSPAVEAEEPATADEPAAAGAAQVFTAPPPPLPPEEQPGATPAT